MDDEELLQLLLQQQQGTDTVDNKEGAHQQRWKNLLQEQQIPTLSRDSFTWTIDADGDQQEKELQLKFDRSDGLVLLTATYRPQRTDKTPESKPIGFFQVKKPELFYVWHEISSNGMEPYQLFFSLDSFERAFLDGYAKLPLHIRAALIKEINENRHENLFEEVVDHFESDDQYIVGHDNHWSKELITPLNLAKASEQDVLEIKPVKTGDTITYVFSKDEKVIGSFSVLNEESQEPLLTKGNYSKKDKDGKIDPVAEKEAEAADLKFGTFTIPVKAGDGNHSGDHDYQLLFVPGEHPQTAKVYVSADGRLSWPGAFTIPMPYSNQRDIAYTPVVASDHLDIYFHPPGLLPVISNTKPDLSLRIQKMSSDLEQFQEYVYIEKHRVEALHIYTKAGHRTYPLYYRNGMLQTRKANPTDDAFQKAAVKHARKNLTTPTNEQSLKQTKEALAMQEEAMVQQIWLNQMPSFKLAEYTYVDLDKDPKEYYQQYLSTMVLLRTVAPLLSTIKETKALPTDPFDVFQLKMAAEQVNTLSTWIDQAHTALISPEIRDKVPNMRNVKLGKPLHEVLDSEDVTALAGLNIDAIAEGYRSSMLYIGKQWMKRALKPDENRKVKDAQKKGIDEIGNRRKNFHDFAKEKGLAENQEIIKVPAFFYLKTDWYAKEREKMSKPAQQYLDTHQTPALEVPIHVYKQVNKNDNTCTWHVVSTFSRTMDTHYYKSLELKTAEDQKTYADFPPIALFELLNNDDHLPPGWLIYNLPDGSQATPIEITTHVDAEDIAMWVGLILLAAGVIFFTGGWGSALVVGGLEFSAASAAFTLATLAGGTGAALMLHRKGENGTLTQEEKVFAWLDIASALLAGPLFLAGAAVKGARATQMLHNAANYNNITQSFQRMGGVYCATIKLGDLAIDSTVMIMLAPKALEQISDIMAGPGSTGEKTVALAKVLPLLALQYGLFLGTFKGRAKEIGNDASPAFKKIKEMLPKALGGGNKNIDSKAVIDPTLKVDQTSAPEIQALKKAGWDTEALNAVYSRAGEKRFLKRMDAFNQVDAQELKVLKKLYPEEDLLYALYTHGSLKKARQALDAHFGYANSESLLQKLRAGEGVGYSQDVAPKKKIFDQKVKDEATAKKTYDDQTEVTDKALISEGEMAKAFEQAEAVLSQAQTRKTTFENLKKGEEEKISRLATEGDALRKGNADLQGKNTETLQQDLKKWQDELGEKQREVAKQKKELEIEKDVFKNYKKEFNDKYQDFEKTVEAKKLKKISKEQGKFAKKMRDKKGRFKNSLRLKKKYAKTVKRLEREAQNALDRFRYDKRTKKKFDNYVAYQEKVFAKKAGEIKQLEDVIIPGLKKNLAGGKSLVATNQRLAKHQESLATYKGELQGSKTDVKNAELALQQAKKDWQLAQDNLKTAQVLKGRHEKAWKQAQLDRVNAETLYKMRIRQYRQLKTAANQASKKVARRRWLMEGIKQRYHWQYQLAVLLRQGLAKPPLRYGQPGYLDQWKGIWSIAKTLVGMVPGQVGDYPLEVQATIKAYKKELDATLLLARQGLAAYFREYTVELTQKAATPAEAFAIVAQHLQSLEKVTDDFPKDALQTLVSQLIALQKDIVEAEKALLTPKK
ncbi:hypothetical protein [Microscilla marina]|uniref:Uncharacterized protein n=1 Tax=Microscilla marina ATCC 23134 TaxID=313606 RepID=A1ZNJ3_MICM2|nr:hypothetical protein [Microscilla marina]EAY28104.1 hypothetical protein M23134_02214 [Microscilla marina ATCC 23134]